MDAKPDGRMYARITQRSVAIISHIQPKRIFSLSEIAEEIYNKKLPEFYLKRFNRQMSISRTRAYVRFLHEIGAIESRDDKYELVFRHRDTDGEWAQALSDLALVHLSKLLNKPPQDVPEYLEAKIEDFYRNRSLPTLERLAMVLDIGGGRAEEVFKWSIYLYTDGEACPFDIRHYPVLLKKER